jgi:transposase
LEAIKTITTKHKVNGLITVESEKQTEQTIRYIGRGRGSKNRDSEITEKVRYQITSVAKNQEQIAVTKERFGWKAFVTSVVKTSLSLPEAILNYRNEYRIERIFNRLKNRLNIAPLFVKRDDQITGLTHLLSMGVRVLTLLEFVVRRSLENDQSKLTGLHPENNQKSTDKPTAERILKAFSNLSLTIIKTVAGELRRYLTPLSELQKEILNRLGLDLSLYLQLEILNSQNLLSEW